MLASLALVACTGGGSGTIQSSSQKSLDLARAEKALRREGAIALAGTASEGPRRGRVHGAIDAAAKAEILTFPVFLTHQVGTAEFRRAGARSWLRRVPFAGAAPAGLAQIVLAAPGERPWLAVPAGGEILLRRLLGAYDPAGVLGALARAKVHLVRDGSATIAGKHARAYRATLGPKEPVAGPGVRRVTVWVDADQRPLRFRLDTQRATIRYDVERTTDAVAIHAPPEAQVATVGNTRGPAPVGPYATVLSGTSDGVSYQVLRAPADGDGTCWRLESSPSYQPAITDAPDGRRCLPAVAADAAPEERVVFPLDGGRANPYEVLAAWLPAGATAELTFVDGSTRPLARDPATGLALYLGPAGLAAGYLGVTLADGTQVACGPGAVTVPADLDGLTTDQTDELRGAPWTCLPAAAVAE